jgi:hypothetical protein
MMGKYKLPLKYSIVDTSSSGFKSLGYMVHDCRYVINIFKVFKGYEKQKIIDGIPFNFKVSKNNENIIYISGKGLRPEIIKSYFWKKVKNEIKTKRIEVKCFLVDNFIGSAEYQAINTQTQSINKPCKFIRNQILYGNLKNYTLSCYSINNIFSWGINFELISKSPVLDFNAEVKNMMEEIDKMEITKYQRNVCDVVAPLSFRRPAGSVISEAKGRNKQAVMNITAEIINIINLRNMNHR